MHTQTSAKTYAAALRAAFRAYRLSRFAAHDHLFQQRPDGEALVFDREHVAANLLIPPFAAAQDRQRIIDLIAPAQRHRHFGSMRSSQALAQSVFGTIAILNRLPLISDVVAEDGRAAFGPELRASKVELEKEIQTLGEPRKTSVDVWVDGSYRVAVECKLSEPEFGVCSRPRLRPVNPAYAMQYCDGTYTRQRGRTARCPLTTIGVRYWDYATGLFGWPSDTDHRPCPLVSTYQIVRNVLAVCVDETGSIDVQRGHALIIYDARNPTMLPGGEGDRQWRAASGALTVSALLRRLSWQAFISQWPSDSVLDWLRGELDAKYGFCT
jgi:hypothetical protein